MALLDEQLFRCVWGVNKYKLKCDGDLNVQHLVAHRQRSWWTQLVAGCGGERGGAGLKALLDERRRLSRCVGYNKMSESDGMGRVGSWSVGGGGSRA